MFCMLSRYQTSPDKLPELVRLIQEKGWPMVSSQPGFKDVCLMTKPDGEFLVLNIWETETQARAWPSDPSHHGLLEQLGPLVNGAPVREGYEFRACKME